MFESNTNQAQATLTYEGSSLWSQYYDLPNKKLLLVTHDQARAQTFLKIFSANKLDNVLSEQTLDGNFKLFCIFPNGEFLLQTQKSDGKEKLIKITAQLQIKSTQDWQHTSSAATINDTSFFVIRKNQSKHSLIIYQWQDNDYKELRSLPLTNQLKHTNGTIENIQFIKDNYYCCVLRGFKTNEFRILVLTINSRNYDIKEIGIIEPKTKQDSSYTFASGNLVILPNGRLLTHQSNHDNVQVWDPQTLGCLEEWNWGDNHQGMCFSKIIPFSDSVYWLLQKEEQWYLYNTHNKGLKPINLPGYTPNHILPSGKILAFSTTNNSENTNLKVAILDLEDISAYRNEITKSELYMRFFFKENGIPRDIVHEIYTLSFIDPQHKESEAIRLSSFKSG